MSPLWASPVWGMLPALTAERKSACAPGSREPFRAGRWHGHALGRAGTLLVQLDRRFPGGGRMSETLFDRASAEPSRIPPLEAAPFGSVRTGVILAAGRSERLVNVTAGGSKALVRIGGLALVE